MRAVKASRCRILGLLQCRVSAITVSERAINNILKNEDYLVQGAIALKMRNKIQPRDRLKNFEGWWYRRRFI